MSSKARLWSFVVVVLVIAAALALFVSPFASTSPDGLESVVQAQGESASEGTPVWDLSPMGDYRFPGVESEALSTGLAGLIGVVGLFVVVVIVGRALGQRRTESG
jgi:cobalt/nickel transport protein